MDNYELAYYKWERKQEMTNGRAKGANFERLLCSMCIEAFGDCVDPKRNLEQTRSGGSDICGVPGWSIEAKRYSSNAGNGFKPAWWAQCCEQANEEGCEPVLIYKYDRQPIKCVVRLSSINADYAGKDNVAEISFSTWCMIVREGWADADLRDAD